MYKIETMKYLPLFFSLLVSGSGLQTSEFASFSVYRREPRPPRPPVEKPNPMIKLQETFNRWYSGPLLPGSAYMMPERHISLQTYVYGGYEYAHINAHYIPRSGPHLFQLQPQINALQLGIAHWLDVSAAFQAFANWREGEVSGGIGDTTLTLGFPILKETIRLPAMKLGIGEILPTGRYRNFTPSKAHVQATGQGSCQTIFSYRIAKIFFRKSNRPMNLRATLGYIIPSTVKLYGFNTYGGANNTWGTLRPGNQINMTIGSEWQFWRKWVFVNDLVYIYNNRDHFHGWQGTKPDGSIAKVGRPSNEQLSYSPSLQYNPFPSLNILGGIWTSLFGRNTDIFIQAFVGITYVWDVN